LNTKLNAKSSLVSRKGSALIIRIAWLTEVRIQVDTCSQHLAIFPFKISALEPIVTGILATRGASLTFRSREAKVAFAIRILHTKLPRELKLRDFRGWVGVRRKGRVRTLDHSFILAFLNSFFRDALGKLYVFNKGPPGLRINMILDFARHKKGNQ